MAANGRMTRTLARQQSAYEDQARAIQKRIIVCREAYGDAQDFLQDEPIHANDHHQRVTQLIAQYRANITQLNLHAANLEAAMKDWLELMRTYNIPHEDSDWAAEMRSQHDSFFGQAPNLDFDIRELIALYRNAIRHAQGPDASPDSSPEFDLGLDNRPTSAASRVPAQRRTVLDHSDDSNDETLTRTSASNGASDKPAVAPPAPTNLVGQVGSQQGSQATGPTNLVGTEDPRGTLERQNTDTDSTPAATQPPPNQTRTRDAATEIPPLDDLSLRSEADDSDQEFYEAPAAPPLRKSRAKPAAAEHRDTAPRSRRRTSFSDEPYGLFAQADGHVTQAKTMAWHTTPNTYDPRTKSFFYSTASAPARTTTVQEAAREAYRRSPLYLASLSAEPRHGSDQPCRSGAKAPDNRDRRSSPAREPSPRRAANPETRAVHRERLQHVLRNAAPPGRGRSDEPAFASAPTAPDGPRPAARTTHYRDATAHHRSPSPSIDHGADFDPVNACKFYQNATYTRTSNATAPPLVLKELSIPKFSGDPRAFPMFRNRFLETVEGRKDLSPRHKFQYLLQYLSGEPLRMADTYLVSDESYFEVLDLLEERYGNKGMLSAILIQALFDLKPASNNATDLRRFLDEARRIASETKQSGEDIDTNVACKRTLTSKLPQPVLTEIYKSYGKDALTVPISEILTRLSGQVMALEASEFSSGWRNGPQPTGNPGRGSQPLRPGLRNPTTGTYVTDTDATYAANVTGRRRCAYCGRDHWALKCNVYITLHQRKKRLTQLGYCFLCLRGGHRSAMCLKRTSELCRFCNAGQHHQSLCRKTFPERRPPLDSSRQTPVRATPPPGMSSILRKEPSSGSSSTQVNNRGFSPVPRKGISSMPGMSSMPRVSSTQGVSSTPPATSCPPSAQISSTDAASNSKKNRRSRSKGSRTGPNGRNGTTRPTIHFADENVTQMDANACGSDGLLPAHQDHLTTDGRSTPVEAQWYDQTSSAGFGEWDGLPNAEEQRGPLDDEEASLPESTGHCSDAESEPPAEEQWADDPEWFGINDYSGYAVSATSPADNHAVLLECLKTTAVNINNGASRPVIVFFDSGSTSSYIAMSLALELKLPYLEKRYMRVNTFGTDRTTSITGFATTVLLRSAQGATVALTLTASDRIVPLVTTALVNDEEIALLQKNDCTLLSTRETPDLLIGQDLMRLFDRRTGPTLPNGFSIAWTCLGPVAAGAGKVASKQKAATSIYVAAASDPEPPRDASSTPPLAVPDPQGAPTNLVGPHETGSAAAPEIAPPSTQDTQSQPPPSYGFNPEDPLNLWTLEEDLDDTAPASTNLVGQVAGETPTVPTNLVGSEGGDSTVVDASTHLCALIGDADADLFGDFSRVENAGIGTSEMTPDDQAAADMLKKIHKRHPDGRYEVPLLFRTSDGEPPSNTQLPTNAPLAKGRSFSTRKMLVSHPKKLLDYHSVIMDWKARGWITEPPKHTKNTRHALSHHPVFKETSTTTATRPVYDASAKLPGQTSLNDWLYRGPILLPEVVAILLRSRLPKIVILADISKAFLQMEVKATHKDCLRFYWFRDPFKEPTDDNLVEYRFERVPFGLKSAPFLLAGVIKLHLESVGTPLALEMLKNCYVDNVLLTADTVSEALAKYREAKEIFAQIGMPLREFASNSAEFNAAVDPADRADLTKLKELGIRWDILSDYWDIPLMPKQAVPPTNLVGGQTCLAASPATQGAPTNLVGPHETGPATQQKRKGRKKADDGRLSKRNMLRLIARIFDPQGLVQAATLLAKLAVQEAWKAEKDWDDEITGELADLWNEAIKDFGTTNIRVPRRVAKGKIKAVEIHVFTDGSSYAYGFTAYLRIINADGTYSTNLVYSRARVKPIKDAEKFTIPRMELLGVLLGTRIAQYLHKELPVPVSVTYLWSDSTIVLHQIANDEAIKEVWTENRLKEIRRLRDSCNIQFRYVPTAENPADIISRGIPAAELQKCEMWWFGAPFLARDSSRWPEQPTTIRTRPSPSDKPLELFGSTAFTTLFLALPSRQRPKQWIRQRSQRKKPNPLDAITEPLPPTSATFSAAATMVNATNLVAKPPKLPSEPILPRETEEKFDRWPRLVRIQYNVVRFAAACLRQLRHKLVLRQKKRRYAPALGFDLGQCVTTLGRQPTLRDLHLVTMIILRKTQLRHPPSAHDRRNLGIFESHRLLYVKGRLGNMKLRPTALTPLYLPREARDTELIILEYHRINGHAGVATTLANLRMRYWFTKGRTTIQKALRKHCFACRRESMHPFAVPPWPQLPTSRVTNARPFFFTGLDFFGPLYLRAPNGSGSYYTAKYYVCIFVCMTLRCVHL